MPRRSSCSPIAARLNRTCSPSSRRLLIRRRWIGSKRLLRRESRPRCIRWVHLPTEAVTPAQLTGFATAMAAPWTISSSPTSRTNTRRARSSGALEFVRPPRSPCRCTFMRPQTSWRRSGLTSSSTRPSVHAGSSPPQASRLGCGAERAPSSPRPSSWLGIAEPRGALSPADHPGAIKRRSVARRHVVSVWAGGGFILPIAISKAITSFSAHFSTSRPLAMR